MSRKPLAISLFCIVGLIFFGLLTWLNLSEMEQYPIHWNAQLEADGFASRNAVLGVLMIIPLTLVFITALFAVIPKIEPLRQNLMDSQMAYNAIWIMTVAFMTFAGLFIMMMYHKEASQLTTYPLKWLAGGVSLLFLLMGNVLGKIRQNYLLGIRTPWTLSSELSWEKTHRIGGKLFVISGVLGLLCAVLFPRISLVFIIIAILTVTIFLCIYSYLIWQQDPNKRH